MNTSPDPSRATILFGDQPDWPPLIGAGLDAARYTAVFDNLEVQAADNVAAVVPLDLTQYPRLARWNGAARSKALYPASLAVETCDDKLALTRFLVERGYATAAAALRDPGPPYPYVWKKRQGAWGRETLIIRSAEDERDLDLTDPDWFATVLIIGDAEYAAHVLRADGRIWYAGTCAYAMPRADGVRGAHEPPLRWAYARGCEFMRLFAGILEALEYEGTACFNYKLVDGGPRLFEINPRFGASLVYDINGYVDAYLAALAARNGGRG